MTYKSDLEKHVSFYKKKKKYRILWFCNCSSWISEFCNRSLPTVFRNLWTMLLAWLEAKYNLSLKVSQSLFASPIRKWTIGSAGSSRRFQPYRMWSRNSEIRRKGGHMSKSRCWRGSRLEFRISFNTQRDNYFSSFIYIYIYIKSCWPNRLKFSFKIFERALKIN